MKEDEKMMRLKRRGRIRTSYFLFDSGEEGHGYFGEVIEDEEVNFPFVQQLRGSEGSVTPKPRRTTDAHRTGTVRREE